MPINPGQGDPVEPNGQFGASSELRKIGEFGLIAQLSRWLNQPEGTLKPLGVACGIGDDAAVLNLPVGEQLLITTDLMVEDAHFIWGRIPPASLGYKLMAANLSDIAAMGGTPRFAVVSLGVNDRCALADIQAIYQGMQDLAQCFQTVIVGGDTVRSAVLTLGIALIGTVPAGKALLRSGARPDDILLVTGSLGKSAAGLQLVIGEAPVAEKVKDRVLEAHYRPYPRVTEGKSLAGLGWVHAMIDISDGLASEVAHICQQSGVGAEVWEAALPIDEDTKEIAQILRCDPRQWALFGGEDYELLLTVAANRVEETQKVLAQVGCRLTPVGRILPASAGLMLKRAEGPVPLRMEGYNHFREEIVPTKGSR